MNKHTRLKNVNCDYNHVNLKHRWQVSKFGCKQNII